MDALYFVVYPEDGVWVAHGLQHNVVTHGESLHEVRENIDVILEAYARSGGYAMLPKAEPNKWELYLYAFKSGRFLDAVLSEEPQVQSDSYALEFEPA